MSAYIQLYDAVPDYRKLFTLLQMAEHGYWTAFNDYINRPETVKTEILSVEEVTHLIKEKLNLNNVFTCCLCEKQSNGWGHSPEPLNNEEDALCCKKCNDEKVIPERIRDATRQFGNKTT